MEHRQIPTSFQFEFLWNDVFKEEKGNVASLIIPNNQDCLDTSSTGYA